MPTTEANQNKAHTSADCVSRVGQVAAQLKSALDRLNQEAATGEFHTSVAADVARDAEQIAEWAKEAGNRECIGTLGVLETLCALLQLPASALDDAVRVQCLRGVANSCVDFDANRERVYRSGESVVALLNLINTADAPNALVKTAFGPVRGVLLENGGLRAIARWLSIQTLEAEPEGELVAYLAARLAFNLFEESKYGQDNPDDSMVTSTVMEILAVFAALNETVQGAVGQTPALFSLLLDTIEKDTRNEDADAEKQRGDASNAAADTEDGADGDTDDMGDYRKIAVSVRLILVIDANLDRFFNDEALLQRFVRWLQSSVVNHAMTAALCLGNLARSDANCVALVDRWEVVPQLANVLRTQTTSKLQHAITGLLKNLALAGRSSNKTKLGEAGIIELVAPLLEHRLRPVYFNTVGVLKHLTAVSVGTATAPNALRVAGGDAEPADPSRTPFNLLLSLLARTEDDATRNEATRALIQVVRHGWSVGGQEAVSRAIRTRLTGTMFIEPIARLAATTQFAVLRNESVIALTLVAASEEYYGSVKHELFQQHQPVQPPSAASSSAEPDSVQPVTLLDALLAALKNDDGRTPIGVRKNICALLECFFRVAQSKAQQDVLDLDVQRVANTCRPVVQTLLDEAKETDAPLFPAFETVAALLK
ncbi:armadillo-type protein [Thamnocephalis sphaerospora]|uniref:Armadillo-type protein n=1 Tax=Thamnocephalis sphaerospora TaxID=78915 RepID=A0A4P9XMK0_9FUNG|nr:armadillo-type protein [Thamnocephalis sphaerospora]|eukprot:RKP07143.1 armadillo-type protein [Thamnocephalis sphaerospora]